MNELQYGKHAVYSIKYHFVWIPKRRKPVLVGDVARRLPEICKSVADDNGWTIHELVIQSDHLHLFVKTT